MVKNREERAEKIQRKRRKEETDLMDLIQFMFGCHILTFSLNQWIDQIFHGMNVGTFILDTIFFLGNLSFQTQTCLMKEISEEGKKGVGKEVGRKKMDFRTKFSV